MNAFLSKLATRSAPRSVVLGNQSADLDSLVAAVVLAAAETRVPLAHVPLADLPLRTEAVCAFERVRVPRALWTGGALRSVAAMSVAEREAVEHVVLVDHQRPRKDCWFSRV